VAVVGVVAVGRDEQLDALLADDSLDRRGELLARREVVVVHRDGQRRLVHDQL
jgi:hypothetical protein